MMKRLLLLLSVSQVCYSQQDSAAYLGEVIITAQRKSQRELFIPYSVSSIRLKDLAEFNPRTTPEALMGMNGVFVQKTNHGGGSPFVRGLTGNQTLILIDGIRLNNSTFRYGPNQYLNTIDQFSINSIEVAKGTGSVQYGSDALGGVVHILSRDPSFAVDQKSFSGRVLGKYMTGDMEKTGRGEIGYSTSKFAVMAGVTLRDFGDIIGGDSTGKQKPSGYDEWAFDVKAKAKLTERMLFTISHQSVRQNEVPVYHRIVLEDFAVNEMYVQQRNLSYARLDIRGKTAILQDIAIIASWQATKEDRRSRKNGSNALRKEIDKVKTAGLSVDINSSITNWWSANSGIELYYDHVGSTRYDIDVVSNASVSKRGLYPDHSKYGNYSLYSLHHIQTGKWIFDGGLRFNTFAIRITDSALGKVKINPSAIVGNAAVMYRLFHNQHVYFTYSSGYRAPNVDDMGTLGIVDFRYEVPSGGLDPEKSKHFELGYKVRSAKFAVNVSAYYMDLENLITRVRMDGQAIRGYPVYQKENAENAYIKGVETDISWQILRHLAFSGSIAYAYGQNLSKDEPLRRVPPLNGRVMLTSSHNNFFGRAEWLYASKQDRLAQGDKDDNRIPRGGTPGWNSFNIYAGYKFRQLQFNMGLQNILNEDYRTHGSGINGYGRSAWVQVSYQL